MSVDGFNRLPEAEAVAELLACCGCRGWAERVAAGRPFATEEVLRDRAERVWFGLTEADWLEAFAQHPRIGERKAASTTYLAHSEVEQFAAQATLDAVAERLLASNAAYEARFGFRYIVFASGRSATELLDVLEERLGHTREEELLEAARQQQRITTLRMTKWLEEGAR